MEKRPDSCVESYVEPTKKIPAFSHGNLDILLHIWLWIMHNGLSMAKHLLVSGREPRGGFSRPPWVMCIGNQYKWECEIAHEPGVWQCCSCPSVRELRTRREFTRGRREETQGIRDSHKIGPV